MSAFPELGLEYHLFQRHYPPYPEAMLPVVRRAVKKAQKYLDSLSYPERVDLREAGYVVLPKGITHRGTRRVSVAEMVELVHLEDFLRWPGEVDELTPEALDW